MRVAALYDIHGNLPALEAALDDVRREGVDLVVVGGDVLPGPMPREALDCLYGLPVPVEFIRGNGEAAVLEHLAGREMHKIPEQAREAVRWVAGRLRPADRERIASWPATLRRSIGGPGEVLFCHATPRSDTEIFTRQTAQERLLPLFDGIHVSLVVCGHTHMQFDRTVGATRVVNAGSVGMPFGEPGAYWLLLEPDIVLRRTPYDLAHAAARIRSTPYPQADAFAEHSVLQPPSEDEILARYASVELQG